MDSVNLVRQLCKDKGVSIARLEKDCGFSNGYIRGLRRGLLPIDRAKIIADYFGVSIDYLLKGTNAENNFDYVLELENGEKVLLECYRSLSDSSKIRLRKYAETLVQLHSMEHPLLDAAHALENASLEDKQHDEDIMNDENF